MLPSFEPVKMSARLLGAKQRFNKERIQLVENVQSARCSPFVISKVLAARMKKLITARMLANAHKDHSIPLFLYSKLTQLKDVRAQNFPRTDFFETLTAGKKK